MLRRGGCVFMVAEAEKNKMKQRQQFTFHARDIHKENKGPYSGKGGTLFDMEWNLN